MPLPGQPRSLLAIRLASSLLAILSLYLLRAWLEIQATPFDLHTGWKPFAAWLLILLGLSSFYAGLFRTFFLAFTPVGNPDPYTLAVADIAAEQVLKARAPVQPGESLPQTNPPEGFARPHANTKSFLKLTAGGIFCGSVYVAILTTSIALCGTLLWLPRHFDLNKLILHEADQPGWIAVAALPFFIFELIAPFYIASWFYRTCDRLATRYFGLASSGDSTQPLPT
jgi:hypothetical protein